MNLILQHEQHDFWRACGHHLLDRDAEGRLRVGADFLRAYLARPELVPPAEACPAERQLHDALLADPRQPVSPTQIAAIADEDARENWALMIAWRDHLMKHRTLEAAYLDIVRRGHKFPHLFVHQLVQVILRNVLDGCDDVFVLRAAELLETEPLNCVVFEDSMAGIRAARGAGMSVVGVTTTHRHLPDVDLEIENFNTPGLEPWLASRYNH